MNNEQVQLLHQAFIDHESQDNFRFEEIKTDMNEIKELLKPIAETYTSASNTMRWFMGLIVAISILVGTVWGIIQIISKLK